MTGPAWAAGIFAALMILVTAICAARLIIWRPRGRCAEPEADALHVLMGIAMAGMFEPQLSLVPGTAWLAVFTAATAWFGWRATRSRGQPGGPGGPLCAQPAPHAVECAAMIYMLLAAPRPTGHGPAVTMPGMAGMVTAASNPALTLVLAMFMLGYLLWTTDQLTYLSRAGTAPQASTVSRRALAPRLAACYKITMSIAMSYMLLTML